MTIADEIRRIRGERTQTALASALGVSQSAVAQWESGATIPSTMMLARLWAMADDQGAALLAAASREYHKPPTG